jgi:hypothetical protein
MDDVTNGCLLFDHEKREADGAAVEHACSSEPSFSAGPLKK